MVETGSKSIFYYEIDPLIKPAANLSVWLWLALLGIPALLLMLIFSKVEDRQTVEMLKPTAPAAIVAPAPGYANHPAEHP